MENLPDSLRPLQPRVGLGLYDRACSYSSQALKIHRDPATVKLNQQRTVEASEFIRVTSKLQGLYPSFDYNIKLYQTLNYHKIIFQVYLEIIPAGLA